ncbi:hypothetical protein C0Q70_16103 [Pomacea canaliculata]|uniref:Spindle and centriole-associated protein 1 n=1 Tax=Pomacea canaliculata TaxID=400727 RepID=A0A2T7NNU5_POMCA|nr:hypothetical protein C0Q70_16103 [Pomacea canaliculata]
MSFVRLGQGRRKRTLVRKKPIWDDSVSDLDVYRASPEEVRQRRELHKSKNHIAVKLEKMRKEKQRQCSGLTNVEARQVAIMKEVLHDQEQLDSVLAKTDQMMAMVKDLFGDDAKKYRGVPTITVPPGDSKRSGNLMPIVPEIQTRTEKLSESVMSTSALNDLSETSDSETEGQQPTPINFQSLMDIQRFQQFLYEEENRNTNAIPSSDLPNQADAQRLDQLRKFLADEAQRQFGAADGAERFEKTTLISRLLRSALNDTGKVKKTKRKTESEISQNASSSFSMSDMRKVLESLQAEIADFELQTGRRPAAGAAQTETFSGYTIALVTAVTKLTYYLRETEKRLQMETMVREQLTQDVRQLAITVDSLTSEVIMTQEEYGKLFGEHERYRQQIQGELAMLHAQILDLKHQQSAQTSQHSTPARAASAGLQNGEVNLGVNDQLDHPSTAVLLSPVIRKTRVTDGVEAVHLKTKKQTSLVDITSLAQADGFMPGQEQVQTLAVAPKPLTVASMASSSSSSQQFDQNLHN